MGFTETTALSDCDDCRHHRPINRCRVCTMLTFLIVRKRLSQTHQSDTQSSTGSKYTFLLRDVCTVIFSKLPQYLSPPKGTAYRLRDCGKRCRIPNSEHWADDHGVPAICGIEFKRAQCPNEILYCTAAAMYEGACGTRVCRMHQRRIDIHTDTKKKHIADLL